MEDRRAFPSLVRTLAALLGVYVGINGCTVLMAVLRLRLSARGIILSRAFLYAVSGVVELVCMGLPAVLWSRRGERRAAGAVRRDPLEPGEGALIVLAAASCVPVLARLVELWCALLDRAGISYSQGIPTPEGMAEIAACLLSSVLITPVCEEELFRGRLFAALEALGTRTAVAITTMFFAMMHQNIGTLPSHLCVGLILALLLVRRRSICAPMLFHASYNGVVVLLSVLPARVFEFFTSWIVVVGIVSLFALYFALRPGARMYTLTASRNPSVTERRGILLIAATLATPYLVSIMM